MTSFPSDESMALREEESSSATSRSATPSLILSHFHVSYHDRPILDDINLVIPQRGVTVLLGPTASGKSTLLRTLAGYNDAQPAISMRGIALYNGQPLGQDRPVLVVQKARMLLDSIYENLCNWPDRNQRSRPELLARAVHLLRENNLEVLVDALHQEVINLPLGLQRRLAIVRSTLTDPPLLLLDETTADLPQDDLPPLFDLIRKEGQRRAILFVTHHQGHARATADRVALLCGGEIREASLAQEFFESPQTSFGKQYVRTGSCSMPEPEYNYEESEPLAEEPAVGVSEPTDLEEPIVAEALPEEPLLDEGIQEQQPSQIVPPRASPVVLSRGPRGFHWLKKGVLAGTPRPGLLAEVSEDLESLQRVGIRVLVTLEEEAFDTALLQPFGIIGLHLPVPDMSVTTPEATARLCQQVARYQSEGHPVALHCRAGLGRTGTHLTCQLIYEGTGAHEALEQVRRVEPGWVQSEEQVAFLRLFAEHCKRIRDK